MRYPAGLLLFGELRVDDRFGMEPGRPSPFVDRKPRSGTFPPWELDPGRGFSSLKAFCELAGVSWFAEECAQRLNKQAFFGTLLPARYHNELKQHRTQPYFRLKPLILLSEDWPKCRRRLNPQLALRLRPY
jgi:hypothetical protein